MKVTHQDSNQLTLGGIPGGAAWSLVFALFGVAVTAICVVLITFEAGKGGFKFAIVGLSVGVLLGLCFIGVGCTQLLSRERLELDRVTGDGLYTLTNLLTRRVKETRFDVDRVKEVHIDIRTERAPGGGGRRGGGGSTIRVFEAVLRIDKPRRKVVLDETQNARDERVRGVARIVAEFLKVPLVESDRSGTPDEDRETVTRPGKKDVTK